MDNDQYNALMLGEYISETQEWHEDETDKEE